MQLYLVSHMTVTETSNNELNIIKTDGNITEALNWADAPNPRQCSIPTSGLNQDTEVLSDALNNPDILSIKYRKGYLSTAGKVGVLEIESSTEPEILRIASEINPLEYGYEITRLSKGPNVYLDWKPVDDGKAID